MRIGLSVCLLPLVCAAQSTPVYVIRTVAGSGPADSPRGEFAGDGGPAVSARMDLPTGVAVDHGGNLYFCDWSARIRKVDATTGVVQTIAGVGMRGFSGDGGPAASAQLGGPGSILLDSSGDLYFADVYNHRIRRISAVTGLITTIAGNGSEYETADGEPAVETGIGLPGGMALSRAGDLYFTNGSDKVRKVAAGTGIVTTVAGAGGSLFSGDGGPAVQAQLDQPSAVAVDSKGDLYIAARGEHRIRKVSGGIITTVAGASPANPPFMGIGIYQGGFGGDGGPAVRALLNDPEQIALDDADNLYISDTMNFRIRRVDARTGTIETIAGTGVRGFGGDGGLALRAQMTMPSGICVDGESRIYFGDLFNQRVKVLMPLNVRGDRR